MKNYDWRDDAACKGAPLEWFYTDKGESNAEAMAVCKVCPVIEECLEWGIAHEEFGIFGGTIPNERVRIRKQRRQELLNPTEVLKPKPHKSCGTASGYKMLAEFYRTYPYEVRIKCEPCSEAHLKYNKERRAARPDLKVKEAARQRKYNALNKEKLREKARIRYHKRKNQEA